MGAKVAPLGVPPALGSRDAPQAAGMGSGCSDSKNSESESAAAAASDSDKQQEQELQPEAAPGPESWPELEEEMGRVLVPAIVAEEFDARRSLSRACFGEAGARMVWLLLKRPECVVFLVATFVIGVTCLLITTVSPSKVSPIYGLFLVPTTASGLLMLNTSILWRLFKQFETNFLMLHTFGIYACTILLVDEDRRVPTAIGYVCLPPMATIPFLFDAAPSIARKLGRRFFFPLSILGLFAACAIYLFNAATVGSRTIPFAVFGHQGRLDVASRLTGFYAVVLLFLVRDLVNSRVRPHSLTSLRSALRHVKLSPSQVAADAKMRDAIVRDRRAARRRTVLPGTSAGTNRTRMGRGYKAGSRMLLTCSESTTVAGNKQTLGALLGCSRFSDLAFQVISYFPSGTALLAGNLAGFALLPVCLMGRPELYAVAIALLVPLPMLFACLLNTSLLAKMVRTFETWFLIFNSVGLCTSSALMARDPRHAAVCFAFCFVTMLGSFVDAWPSYLRRFRAVYSISIGAVCFFLAMGSYAQALEAFDPITVTLLGGVVLNVQDIAGGFALSYGAFCVKCAAVAAFYPDSLVILKARLETHVSSRIAKSKSTLNPDTVAESILEATGTVTGGAGMDLGRK